MQSILFALTLVAILWMIWWFAQNDHGGDSERTTGIFAMDHPELEDRPQESARRRADRAAPPGQAGGRGNRR